MHGLQPVIKVVGVLHSLFISESIRVTDDGFVGGRCRKTGVIMHSRHIV